MRVRERMERWLFWTERLGFLILALSWSLMGTKDMWGLLSFDIYWGCATCLKLFWQCTTFFYFLLYAGKTLFQFWNPTLCTKPLRAQGKTVVIPGFEQLALLICESGVCFVKNQGFLLERLALLIWASCLGVRKAYWVMHCSYMVIFPLLNICFAWIGYSTEFQPDLHCHQKKLLDGENTARTSMEGSIKQQHSESVYRRAERALFWVERLGFAILTLAWLLISVVDGLLSWDLLLKCRFIIMECFWPWTNFLYGLMYVGRLLEEIDYPTFNVYKRPELEEKLISYLWLVNNFKNHPGFWLERLAQFFLIYGVDLYVSSSPGGHIVLDLCFTIIFPLLHVYFAWFGYSKEFQNDLLVKKLVNVENGTAMEEIQKPQSLTPSGSLGPTKYVEGKHQSEEPKNLMDKDSSSSSSSASSATNDFRSMLESLEDRMHMEIVNAMKENHQTYLVKCNDAWQTALKVVEKYGEDNRRLKELNNELAIKLSVATTSSQLYQSLLHDNICIYDH